MCRLVLACSVALLPALAPGASKAETALYDNSGPYAAISAGAIGFIQGGTPDVTLSGWRPVSLPGSADYGAGFTANATAGWQFRTGADGDLNFRIEGEYWYGQFQRNNVQVGRLSLSTNDQLRGQALFLNGLVRFAATESTRWWAGAGLGYASLKIPGLAAQATGCNCLGADTATGLSFRAKIQGEYILSDMTALFLELGYVYLPSGSAVNASSQTRYSGVSLPQIGLGLRARF